MNAMSQKEVYAHFAGLLEYPQEDIKIRTEECMKALRAYSGCPPEALEQMSKFQKDLDHIPLDDLRGIYSYTFELTSDFSLDMGYHIYDGFKRANSLASIKAMYVDNGFPFDELSKGELPDYFPVVLRFLGFIDDEELRANFRESFLIKTLEKLNKNFEKNKKNIYSHLISAIYRIIDKDVKEVK